MNKQSLGFFPTPLQKMERLSKELGYEIYFKRDDMTGFNPCGGNKIRKLEYLLGDAMEQGCDTVITYGATQSNHVMETISAARRCGLTPIAYLVSIVEPDADDIRSNLLQDALFGAEIHIIPSNGEDMSVGMKRAHELSAQRIAELEKEGHKCYDIPSGGATGVGSSAYAEGFAEIQEQLKALGKEADYIFLGTGTGGTLAGLTAGKLLTGSRTKIIGINVSPKGGDLAVEYRNRVVNTANDALAYMGHGDKKVTEEMFTCDNRFYGPGYEMPGKEANEAIRYLAKTEGILTDPVYTGKGFYGMLSYLKNEEIPKGSTVVFLHTGGMTALFAEKEILGDLVKLK